jgi:hypothetical protein
MIKESSQTEWDAAARAGRLLEAKEECLETPDKWKLKGKSVHFKIGKEALLLYYLSQEGPNLYTTREWEDAV